VVVTRIQFPAHKTWTGQTFPLRDNIDPLNPRHAFLWMFTGAGIVGAPLMYPTEFHEAMSEHFVECLGIPLDANGRLLEPIGESLGWEPRRKYMPPSSVVDPQLAAGAWVTLDEPDAEPETIASVFDSMSHADRVALADVVKERLGIIDAPGLPAFVKVKDIATQTRTTQDVVLQILEGWGVAAKRNGTVDRDVAKKVWDHLKRNKK
jgi:hypothetical protein